MYDTPDSQESDFRATLDKHKEIFCNIPGKSTVVEHFIPTTGNLVKIPQCRIPSNYQAEVEQKTSSMLQQGLLKEVPAHGWLLLYLSVKNPARFHSV